MYNILYLVLYSNIANIIVSPSDTLFVYNYFSWTRFMTEHFLLIESFETTRSLF
jgi:hypothetical protein